MSHDIQATDTALQAVTAILHNDLHLAEDLLVEQAPHLPEIAACSVRLAAHIHQWWATRLGYDHEQAATAWVQLLAEIETWRARP